MRMLLALIKRAAALLSSRIFTYATYLLGSACGVMLIKGLLGLKSVSSSLVVSTKAKVTASGVEITATLKNPSSSSITIRHPFVSLSYQGTSVATSTLVNKTYNVAASSETTLDPVVLSLSPSALTSVSGALSEILSSGGITLDMNLSTVADDTIPVSKSGKIRIPVPVATLLNKKKPAP